MSNKTQKPAVDPRCVEAIRKIEEASEDSLRFRDFAQLKTYGQDSFSRQKAPELEALVGTIASEAILRDAGDELYPSALKWCARGLSASHAVRKVLVDKEIGENRHR